MTLDSISRKLDAAERLTFDDAVALFRHPDVVAVGRLANRVRERLHGDRTYFNRNMRIEVTNVCVASCLFCSFAKLAEGAPGAHTMRLEEAWAELESRMDEPPARFTSSTGCTRACRFRTTRSCSPASSASSRTCT
jgi:aminodeoxyfutalosine synthase